MGAPLTGLSRPADSAGMFDSLQRLIGVALFLGCIIFGVHLFTSTAKAMVDENKQAGEYVPDPERKVRVRGILTGCLIGSVIGFRLMVRAPIDLPQKEEEGIIEQPAEGRRPI